MLWQHSGDWCLKVKSNSLLIRQFNFLEGDEYTKIGIAIIVQMLEGLHALCYRKGQELSWFCPSVFFYLVAVCPSVWILEIQMTSIRRERLCLYYQLVQAREFKHKDQKRQIQREEKYFIWNTPA